VVAGLALCQARGRTVLVAKVDGGHFCDAHHSFPVSLIILIRNNKKELLSRLILGSAPGPRQGTGRTAWGLGRVHRQPRSALPQGAGRDLEPDRYEGL
jgi:hypothetical protein